MSETWHMKWAMSDLMTRHGVMLTAPQAVPLSEPTTGPMVLSDLAATGDVDTERVCFAPFAFELAGGIPSHFDHSGVVAGRIAQLEHNARGELTIHAYVDHETARRCNAFSVSGDVLDYSLHDTDRASFYARVEKIRLMEISPCPNPVNAQARVLRRELPSPLSRYTASRLQWYGLMIRRVEILRDFVEQLQEKVNASG